MTDFTEQAIFHAGLAEGYRMRVSDDRLSRAQMPLNEIGVAQVHATLALAFATLAAKENP